MWQQNASFSDDGLQKSSKAARYRPTATAAATGVEEYSRPTLKTGGVAGGALGKGKNFLPLGRWVVLLLEVVTSGLFK